MKDLLVVQAKKVLKVTSVAPIRNFAPPAVVILGEKFNLAQEITFNGIEVKEFLIASPTRIVARIPDTQVGQPLTELRVLTSAVAVQQDSLLSLTIGRPIRKVEGIERLVQEFVLTFMSTPGSDIFNPAAGGGVMNIIGHASAEATAEITQAVDRTRRQLLQAQANNTTLPAEERLLTASLTGIQFDQSTTSLQAVVDLRNVAGDSSIVTIR